MSLSHLGIPDLIQFAAIAARRAPHQLPMTQVDAPQLAGNEMSRAACSGHYRRSSISDYTADPAAARERGQRATPPSP